MLATEPIQLWVPDRNYTPLGPNECVAESEDAVHRLTLQLMSFALSLSDR